MSARAADFGSGAAMRNKKLHRVVYGLLAAGATCAMAGAEDEFKGGLRAAEAANKEAGKLRHQWTTTASTLAAAKKSAMRRVRQGHRVRQGSRGLAKASIFSGHQREDPLEGFGNSLKPARRAETRMTSAAAIFLTLAGAATLSGSLPRSVRRPPIIMRAFTISSASAMRASCTTTDTHARFGRFSSRGRASISCRFDAGQSAASGRTRFLERFGIRPDSADAYAFTCIEFEKPPGDSASSAVLRI